LRENDWVNIEGQVALGQVISIQKNKALVAMGDLRSNIELSKLSKVSLTAKKQQAKLGSSGVDFNSKMQHFSHELNLIGLRGEEAVRNLNAFLDEAILLGIKQVRIVHGKGYGILRKLVRTELKINKFVGHFSDEQIELGGDGVTIVSLKV
jgi:DNA mismatch repair protein MutS2